MLVTHIVADILRARILAIACGYKDGNDLDHLRNDPAFKLACGRLPDSGEICARSRPSRAGRMRPACAKWRPEVRNDRYLLRQLRRPPRAVTLDIDDTVDVVHGAQQLSLFNTHYGERCFLPIHVYETATARPVAVLLRSGKIPSGREVCGHIAPPGPAHPNHWPEIRLTIRGDSHYGRQEAMAWCEANRVDYVFGLAGNPVLHRLVEAAADDVRVRHAEGEAPVVRRYTETSYGAASWNRRRRVAARAAAS